MADGSYVFDMGYLLQENVTPLFRMFSTGEANPCCVRLSMRCRSRVSLE